MGVDKGDLRAVGIQFPDTRDFPSHDEATGRLNRDRDQIFSRSGASAPPFV